jgi:hypothetical protein
MGEELTDNSWEEELDMQIGEHPTAHIVWHVRTGDMGTNLMSAQLIDVHFEGGPEGDTIHATLEVV